MAMVPIMWRVAGLQYTGANSTEIRDALNAMFTRYGMSNAASVQSANGSQCVIRDTDTTFNTFTDYTVNVNSDWVVIDEVDHFWLVKTPSEMAALWWTWGDIMTQLAATPQFASAVGAASARTVDNAAVRSIVTGTGATGFQVSATRAAEVNYKIQTSTTATIGGASSATVVLEVCPTNSATAGDWKEVGRVSNSQTITLAVALQSVQVLGGNLIGYVPAGHYAKLRSITSGTASTTYLTGQEVLL